MKAVEPIAPMFGNDERAPHLRSALYAALHRACEAEQGVSGPLNGSLFVEAVLGAAAALIGQQVEVSLELDQLVVDLAQLFGQQLRTETCAAWAREMVR